MVTAEELATSGIRGRLQEMQRVCENGVEAVPTPNVKVIELAREGADAKRKNEALSDQNTNSETKLVRVCSVGDTMREQLGGAECRIPALKTHLVDAWSARRKSAGETATVEADLRAQVAAVKELLSAERARVGRLERGLAVEAEKRQQPLVKPRETSQMLGCELVEDGESVQNEQFKLATLTVKLRKRRELATVTAEALIVA